MSQELKNQTHPKKIAIIGSGNIGMDLLSILHNQYPETEIVVWNRESGRGLAAAITGDQKESLSFRFRRGSGSEAKIKYTTDLDEAMRGADIIEITGGIPRTDPNQPRSSLAVDNVPFIDPIALKAKELEAEDTNFRPNYFIATNPIGIIDQRFQEISGVNENRIVGLSGELDVERLKQSIRLHLDLEGYDSIRGAKVVGDHGPNMVPLFSQIEVYKDGEWKKLLDIPEVHENNDGMLKEFKDATVKGGGKIVGWNKQSDHRAPAAALALMTEQLVDAKWGDRDLSQPIVGSVLNEEYGINSGTTIKFNADGTHSKMPLPEISVDEQKALITSLEKAKAEKKVFEEGLVKKAEEEAAKAEKFAALAEKINGHELSATFLETRNPKLFTVDIQVKGDGKSDPNIIEIKDQIKRAMDIPDSTTVAASDEGIKFVVEKDKLPEIKEAVQYLGGSIQEKAKVASIRM